MKIIEPHVELINAPDYKTLLTTIEAAGRTCYKSEDKITDGSAEKFVRGIIKRGHEAVIEHGSLTVRFICDRGVSHEIVRHRLAAFCQESTRYCNYGKEGFGGEITVIRPSTFADTDSPYRMRTLRYEGQESWRQGIRCGLNCRREKSDGHGNQSSDRGSRQALRR